MFRATQLPVQLGLAYSKLVETIGNNVPTLIFLFMLFLGVSCSSERATVVEDGRTGVSDRSVLSYDQEAELPLATVSSEALAVDEAESNEKPETGLPKGVHLSSPASMLVISPGKSDDAMSLEVPEGDSSTIQVVEPPLKFEPVADDEEVGTGLSES